jgi:uncharacterized spore protein YtfJ
MQALDVLTALRDKIGVQTVVGEPIQDKESGLTLVPVARVNGRAGGGGGTETDTDERSGGEGIGFTLHSTPTGVFVIGHDKVRWLPAVDVNRVILGGQLVAIAALLTVRAIVRARRTV